MDLIHHFFWSVRINLAKTPLASSYQNGHRLLNVWFEGAFGSQTQVSNRSDASGLELVVLRPILQKVHEDLRGLLHVRHILLLHAPDEVGLQTHCLLLGRRFEVWRLKCLADYLKDHRRL